MWIPLLRYVHYRGRVADAIQVFASMLTVHSLRKGQIIMYACSSSSRMRMHCRSIFGSDIQGLSMKSIQNMVCHWLEHYLRGNHTVGRNISEKQGIQRDPHQISLYYVEFMQDSTWEILDMLDSVVQG